MSYFILDYITIKEKENLISLKGGYDNAVPRKEITNNIEGQNFDEKIEKLIKSIKNNQIKFADILPMTKVRGFFSVIKVRLSLYSAA